MPKIADLERVHPTYDPSGQRDLDLFYRGGQALIGSIRQESASWMLWGSPNSNFIRRQGEPDTEYSDRKNRAYALGYMGTIIDFFASSTFLDPLHIEVEGGDATFYEEFGDDCDRRGTDVAEFARMRLIDALLNRRAHALVDMPSPVLAPEARTSLAAQDEAGERRAYLTPIDVQELRDWDEDDEGSYSFFVVRTENRLRGSVSSKRDRIGVTWLVYEGGMVTRYFASHKVGEPMKETEDAVQVGEPIPRDVCPLVPLALPPGLHVGAKLLSAERELFNKQNALSWAEYQSAFAFLLARVKDPSNLTRKYTDGSMALCMPDEDIAWREASGSSLADLRAGLDRTKEEVFRVASQLALAAPLGAVQQAASGEAKRRDTQPSVIVCGALGRMVREWTRKVYDVVASLRGEEIETEATGLQNHEGSIGDLLAVLPQLMSPTAEAEARKRLAALVLPHLTPEQKAEIMAEIEEEQAKAREQKDALAQAAVEAAANPAPPVPSGNGPAQGRRFGASR